MLRWSKLRRALTLGIFCTAACSKASPEPLTPDDDDDANPGDDDDDDDDDDSKESDGDDTATTEDWSPTSRVILHRLNRSEYNRTIRDLFGADLQPAQDFPSDDPSLGFDNIAQVLTLSPLQFELYERTADDIARTVLNQPTTEAQVHHFEAESINQTTGGECCNGSWNLYANGQVYTSLPIAVAGKYKVRALVFGQQAGDELPHAQLVVDDNVVGDFTVQAVEGGPEQLEVELNLSAATHQIALAFTNDFYDPDNNLDRNLIVDWLEVHGPFDASSGDNPLRDRLVICDPAVDGDLPCLQTILQAFLPRALRRAIGENDIESYANALQIAKDQGEGFERGLFLAVKRALLAPDFLFRVEIDDTPSATEPEPLNAYELASRLSYFVWSSMPDDELLARAADDSLLQETTLGEQVERMLNDNKAQALVDNFAGQWLSIRALNNIFKDPVTFPTFDEALRQAMKAERELFFASFIARDRPLTELLTADQTWLNATLAAFYQIPWQGGDAFVETSVRDTARRGVLGQAGLMTVLGHPESTAPVLRGKWILEHLLCISPPPPPGDIDIPPIEPGGNETMREKLARHRQDPLCASCHNLMDPLGLSLENFDGIGAFRNEEAGQSIDVSATMPDGTPFVGPIELSSQVVNWPSMVQCSVEKTMTYALGRGLDEADEAAKNRVVQAVQAQGLGLRTLLREVILSSTFRHR